jgi:hypothetical protein
MKITVQVYPAKTIIRTAIAEIMHRIVVPDPLTGIS